jgi:hypothetical protein
MIKDTPLATELVFNPSLTFYTGTEVRVVSVEPVIVYSSVVPLYKPIRSDVRGVPANEKNIYTHT